MAGLNMQFSDVRFSLSDLIGHAHIEKVCALRARLTGEDAGQLSAPAKQPVDFYPQALQARLRDLLPQVGQVIVPCDELPTARGATTRMFEKANHSASAPLTALGYYRVGEDGRLYLITKSEHYHTPLGHDFPGYQLIDRAKALGIPNATHNNTRGHITRLLEEELIAAANGITVADRPALERVLESADPRIVNRVLNLETGSLAAEAALKMILARFYRSQESDAAPTYTGRTPVILVIGNDDGGLQANYHGTTVLTQAMRGMWPEFLAALEERGIFRVAAVRPNSIEDLDAAFKQYEQAPYKIAGFFHEIVMMNYGGRLLSRKFLHHAYDLCRAHDVPTVVDEIQSCMWAPDFFLYREFDLEPAFVVLGKGFPGGEYPASRILFSAAMDNLPQFGALVTNGQEELASLAYLVTMRWAKANAWAIREYGEYYEGKIRQFAARHPEHISGAEGKWHLSTIVFRDLALAKAFVKALTGMGLDISVQTYKADCPPAVLTKLPIIAGPEVIDFTIDRMEAAMSLVSSDGIAV